MTCLRFTNLGYRKTITSKRNVNDFSHRIFVSTSGNDTHTGSEDSPFLTIGKAVESASLLSENSLITILKGDYHISSTILLNSAKRIVITGKKGTVINYYIY